MSGGRDHGAFKSSLLLHTAPPTVRILRSTSWSCWQRLLSFIGGKLGENTRILELHIPQEISGAVCHGTGIRGPILDLLGRTRDFKATNPQDKVFAFFGITDEGLDPVRALTGVIINDRVQPLEGLVSFGNRIANRLNSLGPGADVLRHRELNPDYNKSVVEVYRDVARFLIRKSPRLLDVLSHVQHLIDVDDAFHGEYPTWVPRWFERRSVTVLGSDSIFIAGLTTNVARYYARMHGCGMLLYSRTEQPNILSLDGFRVDRVAKVTDVITSDLDDTFAVDIIWHQLFDCPMLPMRTTLYRDGMLMLRSFGLTLLAGCPTERRQRTGDTSQGLRTHWEIIARASVDFSAYLATNYEFDGFNQEIMAEMDLGDASRFEFEAKTMCFNRRVFLTEAGYFGLGPKIMRPGDQVCVLFGGRVPYVLRPRGQQWAFIGDSYLHDLHIISGTAATDVLNRRGDFRMETFDLC